MLEELMKEARGWLADCGWKAIARDQTIVTMIDCHYLGGWPAFVAADNTIDAALIYLLMQNKFGLDFTNKLYWSHI